MDERQLLGARLRRVWRDRRRDPNLLELFMILDIRGTNGAGKSWIVHSLLDRYGRAYVRHPEDEGLKWGHVFYTKETRDGTGSVGVVGNYDRTCGGCDSIKTPDEICDRVRFFAKEFDHVIFEGITVAHTYGRYAKLADEMGRDSYYFLFLTTPLRNCIARVRARRLEKGNTKPFDPYKHMGLASDYDRVKSAYNKLKRDGVYNVVDLDWQDPMPKVLELLEVT